MSQEAVEKVLGRMITDRQFRRLAASSLETSCRQTGYSLTLSELAMLSDSMDLQLLRELGDTLHPGLCRAGSG